MRIAFFLSFVLVAVLGQQASQQFTTEQHPPLTTQQCNVNGCYNQATSVVIDSNWRWLHYVGSYTNCYQNGWNCPDPSTCAANCALEGVDLNTYQNSYGVTTAGSQLNIRFVTASNVGARLYLMNSDTTYQRYYLMNQEFAFDVDVSQLPCGVNGAIYFVEMPTDGGQFQYPGNQAGAKFGTGYCDAQCPHDLKFINGEANLYNSYGTCCNEMDIWESNSQAAAYTAHPCYSVGQQRCSGAECGDGSDRYNGVCDKDGCDFNPFRMGNTNFYGSGKTIDTNQPFTVITQFLTFDGTPSTDLVEIRRFFKQNGVVYENPHSTWSGTTRHDSLTDDMCWDTKSVFGETPDFAYKGGMQRMGNALGRGMVLTLSLWDDHASNMLWLDSNIPANGNPSTPGVARGPCPTNSGDPATVESQNPLATVHYSNIKVGTLGTTSGAPAPPQAYPIYGEHFYGGWENWSWATSNAASTDVAAYSGSYTFSFAPSNYNAAYLHCAGCINTAVFSPPMQHQYIEFFIRSPTSITNQLRLVLTVGTSSNPQVGPQQLVTVALIQNSYTGQNVPANTWVKGEVWLSGFPSGTYDGIWFQENTGGTWATVYLDNIRLVAFES